MKNTAMTLSGLKQIKKAIVLGVCALVVASGLACCTQSQAYAADSSVTYEGGAEKFVFLPGGMTGTDLFVNLKEAMPGDSVTQQITVKNNSSDNNTVKIYLKAVAHDETTNPLSKEVAEYGSGETVASMSDFLSQLSMTVTNNGQVIYSASPDQLAGLADYVLLGSFEKGESTTLTVTLSVPETLGNEYAYRAGEVDWVFMAEEIPHPTPATGDTMMPIVIGIGIVAAIAVVVLIIAARRRKKQ